MRPAQPSSLSWFPTSYMRKNIHNSDYFWPVPHLPRSTLGPASSLLPSPPCHSTPPNIAGHREAKMSSKSFLRSGFKYISQLLGLFFSHLCLFVCQSCLSVCLSALSLECLTSASSVTTLQPLGPLLRLTLHRGKRVSLAAASHTDSSSVCLYFPCLSAYYIVCLSVKTDEASG